jgi:hypothetical protein
VNDSRILGVCILLASVILSAAVLWDAQLTAEHAGPEIGRYQFQPSTSPGVIWVVDTTTGNVNSK